MYKETIFEDYLKRETTKLRSYSGSKVKRGFEIEIDCGALPSFIPNSRKYLELDCYCDKLKTIKSPVLYSFKIVSKTPPELVLSQITNVKKAKGRTLVMGDDRHYPKIKKYSIGIDSKYLYIGSVNKNIRSRFIYHLGYGASRRTYSLQLVHWAKELKLKLLFTYYVFEEKDAEMVKHIEKSLWEHYKPLLGKQG